MLDAFQILQEVNANPGRMVRDVDTPCINLALVRIALNTLLDSVHPTTAGHALFAERFALRFCARAISILAARRPHDEPRDLAGACYGSK